MSAEQVQQLQAILTKMARRIETLEARIENLEAQNIELKGYVQRIDRDLDRHCSTSGAHQE